MAFGSFISVFGKEKIHGLFAALRGKRIGVLGVVPASLIGIASPLCIYGAIPIAASFAEKRAMPPEIISTFQNNYQNQGLKNADLVSTKCNYILNLSHK
jgi:uncharacterized membrane protein YraQ (UPF0718 family)